MVAYISLCQWLEDGAILNMLFHLKISSHLKTIHVKKKGGGGEGLVPYLSKQKVEIWGNKTESGHVAAVVMPWIDKPDKR